jgi:hypothetical protein
MITDLDQALHFISSGDNHKCFDVVAEGTEEIAVFLQELSERGELFRVGVAPTLDRDASPHLSHSSPDAGSAGSQ